MRIHVQDHDQYTPECLTAAEAAERMRHAVAVLADLPDTSDGFTTTVSPCTCPGQS